MAQETTATITGNLGGGVKLRGVFHGTGRVSDTLADRIFPAVFDVDQGHASVTLAKLGAAISASAYSEAGAAPSNVALSTPGVGTLTPTGYAISVAPTSESFNRADPSQVDLKQLLVDEAAYPLKRLLAYESSAYGIAKYWPTQLSNVSGTAGARLTPMTLITAYRTLCVNIGQVVDAFVLLNLKGWDDLLYYGFTTGAAFMGNSFGESALLKDLLSAHEYPNAGYAGSWGRLHIFVDPDPAALATSSSNYLAPMAVPYFPGLNGVPVAGKVKAEFARHVQSMPGGVPLAPWTAVGYRKKPTIALDELGIRPQGALTLMTSAGIPLDVIPRAYAGQNMGNIDVFTYITSIEFNDTSGIAVRFAE